MRYDAHLRHEVKERLAALAVKMRDWEAVPSISDEERSQVLNAIQPFDHTCNPGEFALAGVDGSGDFPAVAYSDSFIYVTVAHATVYETAPGPKLREVAPPFSPIIDFAWMPEEEDQRREAWDTAFESLSGHAIPDVIQRSDYRHFNAELTGRETPIGSLIEELLRPHAADSGNIAIQLRTVGELGSALRLIEQHSGLRYVLVDTTMSLPMVAKRNVSLFYEHLKRLCCVEARQRSVGFFAVSKSHGLPSMEFLEKLAQEKVGSERTAEHWYLRIPTPEVDDWNLAMLRGRPVPPKGAISYLVRFHRNVPVLRLDMDIEYWRNFIAGNDEQETRSNERRVFEDLDFVGHEQRSYGYPYPLKAGHDRASLTQPERVALRKQIVDAAVAAGMKRSIFRDASLATGHK